MVDDDNSQRNHNVAEALQRFVDSVNNYALIMLDPDGVIVSWNQGAERIKGWKADEAIGMHFSRLYPDQAIDGGLPTRLLRVARETGQADDVGLRLRKDGSEFWASVSITAIYGPDRELTGFGKITRDISASVGELKRLEHSEATFRSLVDTVLATIVDGLIIIDEQAAIQFYNPACERLFGYGVDEVVGRNVKMLMPPEFASRHDDFVGNYQRTGDAKIIGIGREVEGQRKDGSTFPMYLSVGEARVEGRSVYVGIIHELTDRKQTQEQLAQAQKMETVGQLSGGVAHDFNNLLTVIVGNSDVLAERLSDRPELRAIAEVVASAGRSGGELTQRLLAFSRRQQLNPVPTNCVALIENSAQMLNRMLLDNVEVSVHLPEELPSILVDPTQLEAAIFNLALNAQDAMPDGGHIDIESQLSVLTEENITEPDIKPGRYISISVTDDGEGMDKETADRVFEPFFTTKAVGRGSGLGLSMVYGFVKQSGGHITLYSEQGLGTSIRLYIPISGSPAEFDASTLIMPPKEVEGGDETILIVEDDPFVRSFADTTLTGLGYRVVANADAQEALASLSRGLKPDLLFSDVLMPGGISGAELADRAQALMPSMKVLLTSGYPAETLDQRNDRSTTFEILTKPYDRQKLARRLREILDTTVTC